MSCVLDAAGRGCVVPLEGPLYAPFEHEFVRRVNALAGRGERHIVLDLANVSSIDAGGIGELTRAYRGMAAVNGALRIVNAGAWVREPLKRVGLLELLNAA